MFMFTSFILFWGLTTGTFAFSVTTTTPNIRVPENQEADLKCSYSPNFGTPRIEWKFKNKHGSQSYVVFNNQPTETYQGRVVLYNTGLVLKKVTREDNGEYICEVSSGKQFGDAKINLLVEVPPSVPICGVPSSVTTGTQVILTCFDPVGSPPSTYKWFKDDTLLPESSSQRTEFKNSSFNVNAKDGTLTFSPVIKADAGAYYCTASNGVGNDQSCSPLLMTVNDINTGGIVAGVIVALIVVILLGIGVWYALHKGYFDGDKKRSRPQVAFSPPISAEDEGEFKQKSSFVV